MSSKPIYVTQPFLPPLEEFSVYLEKIWNNKVLTNGGPMHQELESALAEYLGVNHVALFNNGTIALMTALQSLQVKGEVITTPYSFVATAHSLLWNGLKPIFVDIDPVTLNMDPAKIEAAITSATTAILPVHCYGNPCDVAAIKEIADKHGLKVIYDAAHAFGVEDAEGSILRHGDLSVLSFHATKVFNTFEGGAIVCPDLETKRRIDSLKNFGIESEVSVTAAGLNGKMSEINSAFGLLQLKYVDQAIMRRGQIDRMYRDGLSGIEGIRVVPLGGQDRANYSYFPILVDNGYPLSRDQLYEGLKESGIHARRYFYPLISEYPMYRELSSARPENLPVAMLASERVLCLPLYPSLGDDDVARITGAIRR